MRSRCLALVWLVSVFASGSVSRSQSPPSLDPNLPYQAKRSQGVTYEVDFSVVVTPPYQCKRLKVWLPVPTSDMGQAVTESKLTSFPMVIQPQVNAEPIYGNQFASFEFDQPQGAQIVRHQFKITVWQLNWELDPSKLVHIKEWPASFEPYRRGEGQAVVVDDRFVQLLHEIVPAPTSPAADFGNVMQWVQKNFTYDHHEASLAASSVHGLTKRRGHCSDYHGFCASLGRALGVPTRVTYGINTFPKNSPSHCKLEAYFAPYGWVSFDVSETQRLMETIQKEEKFDAATRARLIQAAQLRLESGFRDNTWYLQTRGTDYDLAPKASKRVAVVRTAYVEADGVVYPEPDPADKTQLQHAWMTVHRYQADKEVPYPFADPQTLSLTP